MPKLDIVKGPPGFLMCLDVGGVLKFQYNPEDVTEKETANWVNVSIHGMHNPRLQYSSGEGRTISFTLKMYKNYNGQSVGDRVRWLRSLVYPNTGAGYPLRPPTRVAFNLGSDYRGVICVVTDVSINVSKFDSVNDMDYAEVQISLLEISSRAIGYSDVR